MDNFQKILDAKLAKLENNLLRELKPYELDLCRQMEQKNIESPVSSSVDVDEFENNVENVCREWWCPKHSNFKMLVKSIKPSTFEDELIIRRANSRHNYWSRGNVVRCCTIDRQRKNDKKYSLPSCWPLT